jgi:hypothetical protein
LAFARRVTAPISGRPDELTLAWHVAKFLEHIQFIAGNARPSKRNGTHITENRQQALGTGDRSTLIDATNRGTGDDIVVNRAKWQRRKFWKLARQSPVSLTCLCLHCFTPGRRELPSDGSYQYAALRIAASDEIVVIDDRDARRNISRSIQAYNIGIFSTFTEELNRELRLPLNSWIKSANFSRRISSVAVFRTTARPLLHKMITGPIKKEGGRKRKRRRGKKRRFRFVG